jgi:protoporphyrinogen/coproporphyrinogen III oxidase
MADVIVVGGGISGLAFAFHAARAGRSVLVLEKAERPGGCFHTAAGPDDFWLELGAHTAYNSYGSFIEILEGVGLMGELQPRAKPILRFLDGDRVLPGKNMGALLRRMRLGELLLHMPRAFARAKGPETMRQKYGRIVGETNYVRALGPMLSAVPSQNADNLPAEMLFKKRPRRKDVLRSFTLRRGLGAVIDALAKQPGITVATGRGAKAVAPGAVELEDGTRETADIVALAVPPAHAGRLLGDKALAAIGEVEVDSLGLVVRADKTPLPLATFLIPTNDAFFSIVARDVVPHPTYRGFAFHFKPGLSAAERRARAEKVVGTAPEHVSERVTILPSPALGHADLVAALDRRLGPRLAVTGNWFAGLGIEDCTERSRAEWNRVAQAK